jgi:hypothetical protein
MCLLYTALFQYECRIIFNDKAFFKLVKLLFRVNNFTNRLLWNFAEQIKQSHKQFN